MLNHSPKKISSLQHPFVKHLVKVRTDASYRQKAQSVLVLGRKMIDEIGSHLRPMHLIATPDIHHPFGITHLVTEEIMKKVTGLTQNENIAAEFPLPHPASLDDKKFLLVLDAIADPGNLGTLLRSALALGWDGAFLLPGCADLFNEKVIRASRGACFRLPFQEGTWESLGALRQLTKAPLFIADLKGVSLGSFPCPSSAYLLLSNEARGVNKEIQNEGTSLTIEMPGEMESLNVAIAGGILMYALHRKVS